MPDLYRDLEGIEKEEQASAEKTDQGGIAGRLDQFLSSLMLSLRWQMGLRAWGDPCAYERSPSEDGSAQPATEHWSAAPTQWVGTTAEWS